MFIGPTALTTTTVFLLALATAATRASYGKISEVNHRTIEQCRPRRARLRASSDLPHFLRPLYSLHHCPLCDGVNKWSRNPNKMFTGDENEGHILPSGGSPCGVQVCVARGRSDRRGIRPGSCSNSVQRLWESQCTIWLAEGIIYIPQ